jgi:uncharacterized protein (TIGR02452 family)
MRVWLASPETDGAPKSVERLAHPRYRQRDDYGGGGRMPADRHLTIAPENEAIIKAGGYTAPGGAQVPLGPLVAAACAGTRSYSPHDTAEVLAAVCAEAPGEAFATRIEVTGESSMTAARRLAGDGAETVAVLNFASARNPGGGYLGGARAQEEDLCRVSALYTALLEAPDYYAAHRAERDPFYSHRVIYSPDVPVYRDERYRLLDRPVTVSILTSPAPNAGIVARDRPDQVPRLPAVLAERAARVLAVAARHGRRELVLGAWGCGVFRNDPVLVAEAFHGLLTDGGPFEGRFTRVVFAVFERAPQAPNRAAFQTAFAGVW